MNDVSLPNNSTQEESINYEKFQQWLELFDEVDIPKILSLQEKAIQHALECLEKNLPYKEKAEIFHKIAGSCGSFGFMKLSLSAKSIEKAHQPHPSLKEEFIQAANSALTLLKTHQTSNS